MYVIEVVDEVIPEIKELAEKMLNILFPDTAWYKEKIKVVELKIRDGPFGWELVRALILAQGHHEEDALPTIARVNIVKTIKEARISAEIVEHEYTRRYYEATRDIGEYLDDLLDAGENREFKKLTIRQREGGVVDCVIR